MYQNLGVPFLFIHLNIHCLNALLSAEFFNLHQQLYPLTSLLQVSLKENLEKKELDTFW